MNTIWTPEDEKRYKDLSARRTALHSNAVQAIYNLNAELESAEFGLHVELMTEHADAVIEALTPFSKKAAAQREEEERECRIHLASGTINPVRRRFDRVYLRNSPEKGSTVAFMLGGSRVAEFYDTAFQDQLELPVVGDARLDLTGNV